MFDSLQYDSTPQYELNSFVTMAIYRVPGKKKPEYEPSGPSGPALISGFCSMKRLEVFLLPPGWDEVHRKVTPSIKFASTHLYTWVERGTVRVKCLA